MLSTRISCHGTVAVCHYPTVTKNRNKGYFDQNNTVRIPNVTYFVHKAYITANKVLKLQLLDDWQNFVQLVESLKRTCFSQKTIFVNTKKANDMRVPFS